MAILAASVPETPPPMMVTRAAGVPGTPPSRMPAPPAGRLQRVGGGLHRHPAGDLAHRREQRQPAVGGLHGLVRDRVDPALQQELGQLLVGRQVQVGEQLLTLAEAVVLGRDRLLDLDDQVGAGEHLVGCRRPRWRRRPRTPRPGTASRPRRRTGRGPGGRGGRARRLRRAPPRRGSRCP